MNKCAYLHSFQNVLPAQVFDQTILVDWVVEAHARSEELAGRECDKRRLRRFALNSSYISRRFMECPDVGTDWSNHRIYPLMEETPGGSDILRRNEFFNARALEVFKDCYRNRSVPDQLLHVSCTGYSAPSAPQLFFSDHEKAPGITHAYHMGCYASLPSVRMAKALALEDGKRVDIFHNEMCSLHLNPARHEPEQMVVQTLFADGHICYQVSEEKKGFRIHGVKEKIISDSWQDMGWIPGPHGMQMTLSREVPLKIRDHVFNFVSELAQDHGEDLARLLKEGIFAVHPGGPRIIEVVQKKLELQDHQVAASKKILFDRGNMSSATLPHVWQEILHLSPPSGTPVISLAFGPGLTVFGTLFEVV